MNYKKLERTDVVGTSYQGLIKISYTELCQIFGQPEKCNGDKVQAIWSLDIAGGALVTIYDYKEDVKPRDILLWHIGGASKDAIQLVNIIVKEYRKENK